jgi:hypothetical protein
MELKGIPVRRFAHCIAVAGLLAACAGGEEATTPSSTFLVTTSVPTTSTSTTVPLTPTSTAATTTTTTLPGNYILRADGIGPVDFGTPADEALAFVPLLGPPDRTYDSYSDCYPSVELVQALEWDAWNLRLVFTDWGGTHETPVATSLHLSGWDVTGPGLKTADGLGWGSTVSDLRTVDPEATFWINDFGPYYGFDTPEGTLSGWLNWPYKDFSLALQNALNRHGANLELTGDWAEDGSTQEALFHFVEERGLEEVDMLWALGLPPDDVKVGEMFTGGGPYCD